MKFTSSTIAAASGSTGGQTFARNRYGQYVRRRSVPTQPNSPAQVQARNAFTDAVTAWRNLTAAAREGWQNYADNVATKDVLGQTIYLTAQQRFVGVYSLRSRLAPGTTSNTAAPTIFGQSSLTLPTVTVTAPTTISVAFTTEDEWATAEGGILVVKISRPQARTINFFRGPFRILGAVIRGEDPPTSPASFTSPFPFTTGQRLFLEVSALTADNRLTTPAIVRVDT